MTRKYSYDKSKPRGFAAMDPEVRRKFQSLGGMIAHRKGHAHQWTPETAKLARRKAKVRKNRQ